MIRNVAQLVCFWICAVVLATGARSLLAQAPAGRAEDEAAVRQAGKDYLAAMDRGDSKAEADFWTADGTYTDETGKSVKVRELLEKNTAATGAARPQTKVSNVKVRFVTGDVALEEGNCDTTLPGSAAAVKGHYTALWVRQNGRWKLDTLRETRMDTPANGDNQLGSLGAFTGDWSGEANKMTVHVTTKWDATKKFLRRECSISGSKASLNGTQEIGWDPLSQRIKSWMFNDDGSYSEGLWSLEGNVWMELSSRVLPDGKTSTATQIYKFPDKNTMVWKLIRGSVDGQPIDDFEVVLKRSAAK
jgi:uncharacterized protein (TIGR02246 family)